MSAHSLDTAMTVGFLFAGVGAVGGAATGVELGEGGLANRASTLHGGLFLSIIELAQQGCELSLCLHGQEFTQLF